MAYKWKNLEERVCAECGKTFMQNVPQQIFCCRQCCVNHHNKEERSRSKPLLKVRCPECGTVFEQKSVTHRYCSAECKRQARNRAARDNAFERNARRKAAAFYGKPNGKEVKKDAVPKDGFTWDDVRKIQAETGLSSYHQIIEILKQRKKAESEVM